MKLTAVMPARNEAWVLGLSLRVAATWCDEVILLDHASVDETQDIAIDANTETGKVCYMRETSTEWAEMSHRQRLLDYARSRGATHIAIVDADEVLTANHLPTIRGMIQQLPSGGILQIPMRNMHRSISQYRADVSPFGYTISSLAFADHPNCAWRAANGYPHHQREPKGSHVAARHLPERIEGGIMHLQFSSWRRLLAKHALYKVSERVRFPQKSTLEIDRMYSLAPNEQGLEYRDAGATWWTPYEKWVEKYLRLDAEPWQEGETRRLIAEHGAQTFKGLNLFGVA